MKLQKFLMGIGSALELAGKTSKDRVSSERKWDDTD